MSVEDFLYSAGSGFLFGAVVGYAIKKVMKIAAVGFFVAALAYLSYRGWVDEKWVAMEDASRGALTNASEKIVHVLNNTATQFASHPCAVAASGLPIAATFGFVPGLMMGLKKGEKTGNERLILLLITFADPQYSYWYGATDSLQCKRRWFDK